MFMKNEIQICLLRSHFDRVCFAGFAKKENTDNVLAWERQFCTSYDGGGNFHNPTTVVSVIIFLSGAHTGEKWVLISPWGKLKGEPDTYHKELFDSDQFVDPRDLVADALNSHERRGDIDGLSKIDPKRVPAVFAEPLQRAVREVKANFGQGGDFFGQ